MPESETVATPAGEPADGWVVPQLVRRGLVEAGAAVEVAVLAGGVSGEVFEVRTAAGALVVKRALSRLRVAGEWLADPRRLAREALAMDVARAIDPALAPEVIDFDAQRSVLVMSRAPTAWREWRSELFDGVCDPAVARRVGEATAALHRETEGSEHLRDPFADHTVFVQLRLDPFHRVIADAHPEHRAAITAVADRLDAADRCLVHGDLSPKNILCGPEGLWVIDWETSHLGEPSFDLAFLVTHLALKSLYQPALARSYEQLARTFLSAYASAHGPADVDGPLLAAQVGCLLLARVDGKSPATYLTDEHRAAARAIGLRLLDPRPAHVLDLWSVAP